MTYFQDVYDTIPESVELAHKKYRGKNEEQIFPVTARTSGDLANNGFDLRCEDIIWHCTWNSITDYIEITEHGQTRPHIWRTNYAAKTAAKKLVEDIHREKLIRMPPDYKGMIEKVYKRTGQRLNLKDIMPG